MGTPGQRTRPASPCLADTDFLQNKALSLGGSYLPLAPLPNFPKTTEGSGPPTYDCALRRPPFTGHRQEPEGASASVWGEVVLLQKNSC